MLRMKPPGKGERGERAARRADLYYQRSDSGYYQGKGGMHCEWGGKDAARLGLDVNAEPEYEHFKRVIRGLDPHSGEQLTAKLIENRLPYWDVTASVPKGVTVAKEWGDDRIQGIIWQANRLAMSELEEYATTRVRVDGRQEDRVTGNLLYYSVEHPETRPVEDESVPDNHRWRVMPMPDDHIHNVIPNLTYDAVEDKWKAVKFRPIMDLRRYFDRQFDHHLAHLLAEAGYEIETKFKNGKYYSWDIKGMPEAVIDRFSQRSKEVDEAEAAIVAGRKEAARLAGDPGWELLPDRLSPVERDKLGATSRRQKRDDVPLEECREFWHSLVSEDDNRTIAGVIGQARRGLGRTPERLAAKAVDFALRHHAEQESCIRWEELAATAMERSLGGASPDDIRREAERQGIIIKMLDGKWMATTPELRAEERYLSDVAAAGRGTVAAIGGADKLTRDMPDGKTLNDGQFDTACGLLESENRINLVEGPAGAGKTSMLGKFDEGMRQAGQAVTYLATTVKAAKVLHKDGFAAHTLAHFLRDTKMQAAAVGGRVVIDEVSMMGHKDAVRLFKLADQLDLKLILVGDPMQHGAVGRGAMIRLLKDYGGVTPFKLNDILRQKNAEDARYLTAATQLSEGKTAEGFDTLDAMGWVREIADGTDRYRHISADYVQALDDGKSVICVSPTHAEAARITASIRSQLRADGKLGAEDITVPRLVDSNASVPERGEASTYRPGDILVFHDDAGGYKKGQHVTVADPASVPLAEAEKFSLYRPETIGLAVGDKIAFTGRVKAMRLDKTYKNGDERSIAAITPGGNFRLNDGFVISKDAGLIRHGYVATSFASQGSTVQRAIVAVSSASGAAANQEMAYVACSRAKERTTFFTDNKDDVREALQRSSRKLLALDMPVPVQQVKPVNRPQKQRDQRRRLSLINRVREASARVGRQPQKERQADYGYGR
jgi:conjugative relaxase-like TrwC/TraI family protein